MNNETGQKQPKRHDAGSQANETEDGLNASDESVRHGAEDIPRKDMPVFDRGDAAPKI